MTVFAAVLRNARPNAHQTIVFTAVMKNAHVQKCRVMAGLLPCASVRAHSGRNSDRLFFKCRWVAAMRGACVADGQVGMDIGEVLGILADLMEAAWFGSSAVGVSSTVLVPRSAAALPLPATSLAWSICVILLCSSTSPRRQGPAETSGRLRVNRRQIQLEGIWRS